MSIIAPKLAALGITLAVEALMFGGMVYLAHVYGALFNMV